MALEAVVFPQDFFGCTYKELYAMEEETGGALSYDFDAIVGEEGKGVVLQCRDSQAQETGVLSGVHGNWDSSCSSIVQSFEEWDVNSSSPEKAKAATAAAAERRIKRRRMRSSKNKEEMECQRMTHIAVERNRRKLMNDYLTALRNLMPASYVQRGDQASIIGGAINFVKELEQHLQSLEAQKRIKERSATSGGQSCPFAGFFAFPQYSSCSTSTAGTGAGSTSNSNSSSTIGANSSSPAADIEVTMVESHASLKVLSRRQPKQLLKMVVGLQNLRLTTLHLNMTTIDQMVLYSFSLKMEEDCQLTSVDEIATAVHQMLTMIEEEACFN